LVIFLVIGESQSRIGGNAGEAMRGCRAMAASFGSFDADAPDLFLNVRN
jgi:hypothetical protein